MPRCRASPENIAEWKGGGGRGGDSDPLKKKEWANIWITMNLSIHHAIRQHNHVVILYDDTDHETHGINAIAYSITIILLSNITKQVYSGKGKLFFCSVLIISNTLVHPIFSYLILTTSSRSTQTAMGEMTPTSSDSTATRWTSLSTMTRMGKAQTMQVFIRNNTSPHPPPPPHTHHHHHPLPSPPPPSSLNSLLGHMDKVFCESISYSHIK